MHNNKKLVVSKFLRQISDIKRRANYQPEQQSLTDPARTIFFLPSMPSKPLGEKHSRNFPRDLRFVLTYVHTPYIYNSPLHVQPYAFRELARWTVCTGWITIHLLLSGITRTTTYQNVSRGDDEYDAVFTNKAGDIRRGSYVTPHTKISRFLLFLFSSSFSSLLFFAKTKHTKAQTAITRQHPTPSEAQSRIRTKRITVFTLQQHSLPSTYSSLREYLDPAHRRIRHTTHDTRAEP